MPTTTVVALISVYCADQDPATRKFASFAVGNAAFHSDELYPALAGSIAPLCAALRDPDDKTRANAAGAIGNLIRNGAQLCQAMVSHYVVELMLQLLMSDPEVGPKVSPPLHRRGGSLLTNALCVCHVQRIALFSLGTMASHAITR